MASKNHKKLLQIISANIKAIRQAQGLTQKQVADRLDKDKQAVQKLETGDINPRFITLVEVAEALEVPLSDLLKGVI